MSIPSHLSSYLDQRGAHYDISTHARSHSSLETARCANVSLGKLAKSVILEDEGGFVMPVVPADRMVMLAEFSRFVGRHKLKLAGETRIAPLFDDCEPGAIPPVGMARSDSPGADAEGQFLYGPVNPRSHFRSRAASVG